MRRAGIIAGVVLLVASGPLLAHDDSTRAARKTDVTTAEQKPFGRAGDPRKATRTMRISMGDTMRYWPAVLTIKQGETVRFIVRNDGKTMHEMILGTEDELAKHAQIMLKFPDMEHDEPHMVHVKPGHAEEMVWTFNRPGEFRFACLIPGHFEAGMVGKVIVKQ